MTLHQSSIFPCSVVFGQITFIWLFELISQEKMSSVLFASWAAQRTHHWPRFQGKSQRLETSLYCTERGAASFPNTVVSVRTGQRLICQGL